MKRYMRKWKAEKDGEKTGRSAKRKSSLFGDIAAGIGGALFGGSSSSSSSSSSSAAAAAAAGGAVGAALAAPGAAGKIETPRDRHREHDVRAMDSGQYQNLSNHDFTAAIGVSPLYSVGGATPASHRFGGGKTPKGKDDGAHTKPMVT